MDKVFPDKGFGVMEIDWAGKATSVYLQIRDETNEVQREVTISLENLSKP